MSEAKWLESIIVYTDGACSGNPGPGGWAAIFQTPDGHIQEWGGGFDQTTNNRMEIFGVLRALEEIEQASRSENIVIFTDSTYVIRGVTQWGWAWKKRGWKTAEGNEVVNRDLWEKLLAIVQRLKPRQIHWKWVRGHQGVPGNERCDEIAVAFSHGGRPQLFRGPVLKYPVSLVDFPVDQPLPEMRPREEKKKALSYLSVVGGVPQRHSDWSSCERRVKGQSGARFKKAMTHDEEVEILAAWGFTPEDLRSES